MTRFDFCPLYPSRLFPFCFLAWFAGHAHAQAQIEPAGAEGAAVAAPAPGALAPELDSALADLLARAPEVVRVAIVPVQDADSARAETLNQALTVSLLANKSVEGVTPSFVVETLGAAAEAAARGESAALAPLAADHVVLSEVVDAAGELSMTMRLVAVSTGKVAGETKVQLAQAGAETTLRAASAGVALARLVDELFLAVDRMPGDFRYQRVAVMPFEALADDVKSARVDRFVQGELGRRLEDRGLLVVERDRLNAAFEQMALGASLGERDAPEIGRLLDAQALVLGSIGVAGESFVVNARVVAVETGALQRSATAALPRHGVVTLASDSLETRSPEDAFFRSLVAPGWGQFYNQQPVKGAVFASAGYGGVLATLALGVTSGVMLSSYQNFTPAEGASAAEAANEVKQLREATNWMFSTTLIAAGATGVIWGLNAADAYLEAGTP